jgi:hypothetical protein
LAIDWGTLIVGVLVGLVPSVFTEIAGHSIYDRMNYAIKKRRNRIEITSPRPDEALKNPVSQRPGPCYRVVGRLGFLPEDHQIWLLVQHSKMNKVWPQGFSSPSYRKETGEWEGFIRSPDSKEEIRIVAVVAPPTSQMMFSYYQMHGNETNWAPFEAIPEECRNIAVVRAMLP